MLIGASSPNVPIIKMARDIGYKVVVTDINPEAEGLNHGDYNYNVSAKDIEVLTRIALRHKVDCVYSGTDINFSVGIINSSIGIEGFPLVVGLASEYKNIFRELAEKAKMPITKGYIIKTEKEALDAFNKIGKPWAVIKALNLSSSLGVKKVCSKEEVLKGVKECCELSGEKNLIIEEYVKGTCHDVNGLVVNGNFYPCGIVDRDFVDEGMYFVQKEVICPTSLGKETQRQMYWTMAEFCKKLKIHTSPVKADFLFDGHKFYLLEFGPRFHGEMGFLHMIPGALNVRAMDAYLKYRYSGYLDVSLIEEKIIDRATCRAVIEGTVKSNYDINKYVISFENKKPIEVHIK
jgi:biotin carboxylase